MASLKTFCIFLALIFVLCSAVFSMTEPKSDLNDNAEDLLVSLPLTNTPLNADAHPAAPSPLNPKEVKFDTEASNNLESNEGKK